MIAKLIDYVLITLIFTLLLILSIPVVIDMSEMVGEEMGFILAALYLVVFAALPLAYLVLTEYFMGRTVGKWLLGLRLITDTGQSPGFWSIFLRNILILADQFFLIGLIFMWLHGKEQRIGDLAAGTLVIYERKKGRVASRHFLCRRKKRMGSGDMIGWGTINICLSRNF